jgi:copper transport protein
MSMLRMGRLASVLALIALYVAPALPGATGARVLAHAQLVASSPGAGVTLDESPTELRLVFSEQLEVQVTSLDLRSLDGETALERVGEIDPSDAFALVLNDLDLPDGVYTVTWRTLSAVDGHTAEGAFSFGVGAAPGSLPISPDMTHTETDAPGVMGRWLTYIGLLGALGVAVFHRVVIRHGHLPQRLTRLLAVSLFVSAGATLMVAIIAGLEAGSIVDYLTGTRNGGLQLARAVVAALGGVALLVVPGRIAGAVAAATGLAGIVLLVASGHVAALPGPIPLLVQMVHVAGAAVWIGGIGSLLALFVRPSLLAAGDRPQISAMVPRLSALALVSVGLVGMTGVYAAWTQTGTLLTIETEYGQTLIMKSAFAIGAMALGGMNYLDGGRMIGWLGGLRSRVTVEVMAIAVVLLMTAALATTPPVEEAAGVAIEPIPDAFGETAPGMSMEVVPGRPGVNRIVVTTIAEMSGVGGLDLGLDNVIDGTTNLVSLSLEDMGGMDHDSMGGMPMETDDGTIDWTADAVVLPADSQWDTSVRIMASSGDEVSRQRFAFALGDERIVEGAVTTLFDPVTGVALVLLLGGALGIGLGLGGARLPRCEEVASRVALLAGGSTAVLLGGAIGVDRLLAL